MSQRVDAVVELVIAHDDHVVAQTVDGRILYCTAIEREIVGTLHGIAGMHHEHVFVSTALIVVYSTTTQDTPLAVGCRVYLAVCVVDCKHHKVLGLHERQRGYQHEACTDDFLETLHKMSRI